MKLVTVTEMKAIEKAADAQGVTYDDMMQRAGQGLTEQIENEFESGESALEAVGLVGPGNNGGDTLVALDLLAEHGWEVKAYLVSKRPKNDPLFESYSQKHPVFIAAENDLDFERLDAWLEDCDVLIDGVLGTGIKLPLKGEAARVLGYISKRQLLPLVVAVDCPSGVDCDSGAMAEETIQADLTVCMEAIKIGLVTLPAFGKTGRLTIVDLGLPDAVLNEAAIQRQVISEEDVAGWLPLRPLDSHKGTFGTAIVVAGSINYTGAAYLASRAAYRIGAGLVQAAIIRPLHAALAGQLPEVTWIILPDAMGVIAESAAEVVLNNLDKATALLIGPGLGTEEPTAAFMRRLFSIHGPGQRRGGIGFLADAETAKSMQTGAFPALVVDADGLKLLAKIPDWWKNLPAQTILTPHPGEMSILTGLPVAEIQADRIGTALQFAQKWNAVVILKGAITVVANPYGRVAVIPIATPALARAGTGDVLSGIIVGLRAEGVAAFEAACAGAWIHGQAGLKAMRLTGSPASVLAGEVADSIPFVLEELG